MWADEKINEMIDRAAERVVGFYYEKTRHDINIMIEAFDAIWAQVDKIPHIEEDLSQLKADVRVIKKVVTHTNQDLRHYDKRIKKLERAVFNA